MAPRSSQCYRAPSLVLLRIVAASAGLGALTACARRSSAPSDESRSLEADAPATSADLETKLATALALAEKGGPRVDELLDQFEQTVVQYEALSGPITIDQVNEINQANVDFAQRIQEWQSADSRINSDQANRLTDLQSRLARVLERAAGVSDGS
jgi:hypothetical protein